MPDRDRRRAVLEAQCGGAQAQAFPDGIDVTALSNLALDVLEAVARDWPADHLPAGLCVAVVAAYDRPGAERSAAVGMVLGKFWPAASGDPMELMAGLTSCGLLPGTAGDHAALCR